jgi:putative transposase
VSAFIDGHRERFGVEPICQTLDVSASAYYQRAGGERSERSVEDERLLARIREVHEQNFECYGYPRVWHELRRQGEPVGRDHVARLMRQEGIRGAKRRGKPWRTTIADPAAEKRPDLVNRQFTADAPDRLWVGDLTYLRTWEGRMYFAFLIDVFSRMIIGWQLATWCSTRSGWRSGRDSAALTCSWSNIPTRGRNIRPRTTRRSSTITACWRRSAASETPTTTRWPNHSSTATRPS